MTIENFLEILGTDRNDSLTGSDLEPAFIDDSLNAIIERSQDLEGIKKTNNNSQVGTPIEDNQIGNFLEVLGTDGFDSISGADLQIIYSLAGDDVLNSFPNFGGGSLPNGGEAVILVGGSGSNDYQVRTNSTAIVIENNNRKNNILWTTIGNEHSPGIGLTKATSFFTEIDNRHLYLGDTNSDQYVILVDWQQTENQIEFFDLAEGIIRYTDFVNNFRNFNSYQGNITWDELPAQIDLERLGLAANSVENTFAQIKTRATELESENEIETIELFRFRNTNFATGTYVFVGEAEKNSLQSFESSTNSFALDGITPQGTTNPAFTASTEPGDNLLPFFRLSSNENPGTFLFVSNEEYSGIFAEDSDQKTKWEKQGFDTTGKDIPEFYLYGVGSTTGTKFHRFQNRENNTFLFAGETETSAINNDPNLSNTFIDQGVAFYSLTE